MFARGSNGIRGTFRAITAQISAGTTTGTATGFEVSSGTVSGGASAAYGVKVGAISGATDNWGVYVDGNDSYFGGGKLYLNSTAYLDGSTAGEIAITGDITATNLSGTNTGDRICPDSPLRRSSTRS